MTTYLRSGWFRLFAALQFLGATAVMSALIESGPWYGGVTEGAAIVKARLAASGMSARLMFGEQRDFKDAAFTEAVVATDATHRMVTFQVGGLKPAMDYFYALEINGQPQLDRRGLIRTFPAGNASFRFAFASCARTASTNPVFQAILASKPAFYMNIGDFHYMDIREDDPERFRDAYRRVLGSPIQATLYRFVPFVYMWDDHDFSGNDSDRWSGGQAAARIVYREFVPHYSLPAGDGDRPIYQSFTVGRAKFILTDLRSTRSPSDAPDDDVKSLLGGTQKEWFKQELLSAKGKYPLIFWVSTVPWLGVAGSNFYPVPPSQSGFVHHLRLPELPASVRESSRVRQPGKEDHWSVYNTERLDILQFVRANGITGLCILHGDAHMLAADDGRHQALFSPGGPAIPVLCGAPLDQSASVKGGPYSHGIYLPPAGEGCFGLVTVTDRGRQLEVQFSGRNHLNAEKIGLRFSVPGG